MSAAHGTHWSTDDILKATGGHPLTPCGARVFADIAIDSRNIRPDALFVAIRGTVHDGHGFVADVVAKGVKGLVIETGRPLDPTFSALADNGVTVIGVVDTTTALGDLAAYHRRRMPAAVAAITGANGKTTTRAMTAAVLERHLPTLATPGNRNNQIGLPLTLLKLKAHHRWAVLELGMNHPGEIRYLGGIAAPDLGLITNIGPVHLEGLGSIEGVFKAKSELIETISSRGWMVLNADDPMTPRLKALCRTSVFRFGVAPTADLRADGVVRTADGFAFTLRLPGGDAVPVTLRAVGEFMVANAMAAASIAHLAGIPGRTIAEGLQAFSPVSGRMALIHTPGGVHLLDDTYNANPTSMSAALKALRRLGAGGRTFAVLGDMLELGSASADLHRDLGGCAARCGLTGLFATGRFAEDLARGARQEKMAPDRIRIGSKAALTRQLEETLAPGDWVLVKGSRGMRMETVVKAVRGRFDGARSVT